MTLEERIKDLKARGKEANDQSLMIWEVEDALTEALLIIQELQQERDKLKHDLNLSNTQRDIFKKCGNDMEQKYLNLEKELNAFLLEMQEFEEQLNEGENK